MIRHFPAAVDVGVGGLRRVCVTDGISILQIYLIPTNSMPSFYGALNSVSLFAHQGLEDGHL